MTGERLADSSPVLAWAAVDHAMSEMGKQAYRVGAALLAAQAVTPHGRWIQELDKRGITPRAAQRAMRIAKKMTESEFLASGSIRAALEQITAAARADDPANEDTTPSVTFGVTDATRVSHPSHNPGRDGRHPATWNDALIAAAVELIDHHTEEPGILIDPMAGEGRHYEALADAGWTLILSDIHAWPHRSSRVVHGDATDIARDDNSIDVLLTSPPFGNRLADKMSTDDDRRITYADRRGCDTADNDAAGLQWGSAYRSTMQDIWTETARVLRDDGLAVIDIKDHIRRDVRQHVTAWTVDAWQQLGWTVTDIIPVPAIGYRGVRHDRARTDAHSLIALRRA